MHRGTSLAPHQYGGVGGVLQFRLRRQRKEALQSRDRRFINSSISFSKHLQIVTRDCVLLQIFVEPIGSNRHSVRPHYEIAAKCLIDPS